MLVEFVRAEDFFKELTTDATDNAILDNIVRWRMDEVDEQEEGLTQTIGVWITYIRADDNGDPDSLNSLGILCGSTGDPERDAKGLSEELHGRLTDMAEALGFTVRLGKIELL